MLPNRIVMGVALSVALLHCSISESQSERQPDKKSVQTVLDKVKPAIVRIASEKNGRSTTSTGVLVGKNGKILVGGPAVESLRDGKIVVHLADGRRAKAKFLSWSSEFRVGMLMITEAGSWPHVKLGAARHGKKGETCLGLGYDHRPTAGQALLVRTGRINRNFPPIWGTTTFETWTLGHGIFDLQGHLIGIATHEAAHFFRQLKPKPRGDRDPVFTRCGIVRQIWPALVLGRNVDKQRLVSVDLKIKSTNTTAAKPTEAELAVATKRAKAATIRLRRTGSDPNGGSSGVVVSADGYIISCGHHFLLPGDRITVTFADGVEVPGRILGTNWVTDISVAKITKKGSWPFAPMSPSLDLKAGKTCLTLGYPASRRRDLSLDPRKLSIKRTRIVAERRQSLNTRIAAAGWRMPGESGGGLFDAQGRVVGVAEGQNSDQTTDHVRVEIFRRQWHFLTNQTPVADGKSD